MIFSPIRKLSSKADRSFCFELIDVYCRHVEVYCQVNKIKIPSVSLSNEIVSELRLLGIVEQDSELQELVIKSNKRILELKRKYGLL